MKLVLWGEIVGTRAAKVTVSTENLEMKERGCELTLLKRFFRHAEDFEWSITTKSSSVGSQIVGFSGLWTPQDAVGRFNELQPAEVHTCLTIFENGSFKDFIKHGVKSGILVCPGTIFERKEDPASSMKMEPLILVPAIRFVHLDRPTLCVVQFNCPLNLADQTIFCF